MLDATSPMTTSSSTTSPSVYTLITNSDVSIPSQLKFFMANLTADNHHIWKSQLLKLFSANGFDGYLTGATPKPPKQILSDDGTFVPNLLYQTWILIDRNLFDALYSTISSSLLPYVLSSDFDPATCSTLDFIAWPSLSNLSLANSDDI
ncbi:hypothetical protein M5K25_000966 [Dendrobium thyrsiflorum]|uniref:Retrotransposon Copia-like N-terminal domain-containing protein n=1 Tax=Dendrobium thyrsiflorum TaxID=117978 RepID=A0ABD0VUX5_DENTH